MKTMKLSAGILFPSLFCSAAAGPLGHVFIFDPHVTNPEARPPSLVSPQTARLILSQRLGVSRYHSISDSKDPELLNLLNTYGGAWQDPFTDSRMKDASSAQVFVWLDNVDDVEAVIPNSGAYSASFSITNPPSPLDNHRLYEDLIQQVEALPRPSNPYANLDAEIEAQLSFQDVGETTTHNDYLNAFYSSNSSKGPAGSVSKALQTLLQKVSAAKEKGWPVTIVVMPPSGNVRSAHPYGVYRMPSSIKARRERPEAVLSPSTSQPSSGPQSADLSDLETFPRIQKAKEHPPVLGILPQYFPSLEACQRTTHNCSGHGECGLLHKGDKDSGKRDRYGCTCKPTIVEVGHDGMESKRKVTYWGGPACQKKDVSQPFWLFVGTGLVLAFLISAGIGLLYSMGNEELPSVIGAGVSGPTRK
ncbi:uncharacterized protein EI97DRAFT_389636 [Westerdykella ornata]|uniref:Uncharacterized protein n=1 Tax=Westerdykella ornata TaxID=318751 RepID=A0A6A6JYM5_WESOR|nr:uncharacterized protein EI97DRAFT_389636 [Westerdykella ornata]KAF2281193.1 hypothetical protein EI97DRAFT_389636 [Westerdykella ornata]